MSQCVLVMTTVPDAAVAESIAAAVIARQMAACVSMQPGLTSMYRWEGKVEKAQEVMLTIKTTAAAYPALETVLRELHPYDVPEIIAIPVTAGLPAYLQWVASEVKVL